MTKCKKRKVLENTNPTPFPPKRENSNNTHVIIIIIIIILKKESFWENLAATGCNFQIISDVRLGHPFVIPSSSVATPYKAENSILKSAR